MNKNILYVLSLVFLLSTPLSALASGSNYAPGYVQIPSYEIVDINNRFNDQLGYYQDNILNQYDILDRQFHYVNEHPGAGYYYPTNYNSGYYPSSGYVGNDHYTGPGYVGNDHYTGPGYVGNDHYTGSGYPGNDYYRSYDDSGYYR